MILKRISILNYKNLEQVELDFSTKMNCLIGQNGMGKTNLLDAIYYLSFCKSANNPIDSQNIKHDQNFFVLQGSYVTELGDVEEVYCGLKRRQKKQFKRNKKEYRPRTRAFPRFALTARLASARLSGSASRPLRPKASRPPDCLEELRALVCRNALGALGLAWCWRGAGWRVESEGEVPPRFVERRPPC